MKPKNQQYCTEYRASTSPLIGHQDSASAQQSTPGYPSAGRIYDTGNHLFPPAYFDQGGPAFNALGAMIGVATAGSCQPGEPPIDPAATAIVSPYEPQRRLYEAVCGDLGLPHIISPLEAASSKIADRVVLDCIEPWAGYATEDTCGGFRHDARFQNAAFSAARRETILLRSMQENLEPLPIDSPLRQQIDALRQAGTPVEPFPTKLFKAAEDLDAPGLSFYADDVEAQACIERDIRAARRRVLHNIPEKIGDYPEYPFSRPEIEQTLVQPVDEATRRRGTERGFHVIDDGRGEWLIFMDNDLVWLVGSSQFDEIVRPFARVRGRRTARLLLELYGLAEYYDEGGPTS